MYFRYLYFFENIYFLFHLNSWSNQFSLEKCITRPAKTTNWRLRTRKTQISYFMWSVSKRVSSCIFILHFWSFFIILSTSGNYGVKVFVPQETVGVVVNGKDQFATILSSFNVIRYYGFNGTYPVTINIFLSETEIVLVRLPANLFDWPWCCWW